MLDRLTSDITLALRSIRAAPAIPLAAVLTTSLAVGINLAMAGLIDRALLSPPAYVVHPEQLFTVGFEVRSPSGENGIAATASYLTYDAVQSRVTNIPVAAWHPVSVSIAVENTHLQVKANGVTGTYFTLLGAHASLGRVLLPGDDRPPVGAPVAVLSHSLWRSAFAGDPSAIGRQMRFGALSVEVVGVMPAGFSGHTTERVDLWLPLSTAMHDTPGWHRQARMAVVELGVRVDGNNRESASTQLAAASGTSIVLALIVGADITPEPYRIAMWLTALSLVVLTAALANGATLFLVRNARRRREIHIRAALGATRGRLFRQLFVESAIVAIGATGVALLLALWFDEVVRRVLFPTLVERVGVNRLVIVAALIGGLCTFVVGLVSSALQLPAQVSSEDLAGRRRLWRRSTVQRELLIFQSTLAVLLMTGAGMFAQSYVRIATEHHESRLGDVLMVSFDDGPGAVRDQYQLFAAAVDRLRTIPGVEAATIFGVLPFGTGIYRAAITVPGVGEPRVNGQLPSLIPLTPEAFDILRIDIVQGRRLTAQDDRGAPVVVVSETMASAIWPGTNAIGKCIRIGWPFDPAPCREVVGIARDWRRERAEGRRDIHYYVPFAQGLAAPDGLMPASIAEGVLIRQRPFVGLSVDDIRLAVTNGRTDLPFVSVASYASLEAPRLAHWVTGMQLLAIFGALALATAALGLYAAFAHAVAERRREIAVRLAVGASRQSIVRMILLEGTALAGRGAISGIIVATLAGWVARSLIVGLSSPGLLVSAISMSLVLGGAVAATWLPARAASKADPGELLRVD
jgi:putative ABC transport system permease protein